MKYKIYKIEGLRHPSDINLEVKKYEGYTPFSCITQYLRKFTHNTPHEKPVSLYHYQAEYVSPSKAIKHLHKELKDPEIISNYQNIISVSKDYYSIGIHDILRPDNLKVLRNVRRTRTKDRYVMGEGIFGSFNFLNQLNCAFCFVVKNEKIPEVISYILEDQEDIPNNLFEVWVDKRVYIRGNDFFKKIKSYIKNYIKYYEDSGSTVVLLDKIPFFQIVEIPVFKTLKEKHAWIRGLYMKLREKEYSDEMPEEFLYLEPHGSHEPLVLSGTTSDNSNIIVSPF